MSMNIKIIGRVVGLYLLGETVTAKSNKDTKRIGSICHLHNRVFEMPHGVNDSIDLLIPKLTHPTT